MQVASDFASLLAMVLVGEWEDVVDASTGNAARIVYQ